MDLFEINNLANDKFSIDELLRKSWNYRNSKEFIKFFEFISRFRHYSRFNSMLVYIQNPAITFFGSASFWKKKFGRKIKSNAKPYIILAPKGPVVLVYDVFDTVGNETADEFMKNGLGRIPFEVTGKFNEIIFDQAVRESRNWQIQIFFKPLSYFHAGSIRNIRNSILEIYLKENVAIKENFATLLHELAHLFLGHLGFKSLKHIHLERSILLLQRNHLSKSAKELEAEAISFLICKKLGLETRSAEYLAGYIRSERDLLEFSYETVIKTADRIEKLFIKL